MIKYFIEVDKVFSLDYELFPINLECEELCDRPFLFKECGLWFLGSFNEYSFNSWIPETLQILRTKFLN